MKRKRAFTLLEITLSIVLLAFLSSVVIWNVKKMLDQHEFHKTVEQMFIEMNKAQMLALTYGADLEIEILKKEGVYQFQIFSDGKIKLLDTTSPIILKKVIECVFNDKIVEHLRVQVYSDGRMEPLGTLTFYHETEEKNEEREGLILDFRTPLLLKMKYFAPSIEEET